MYKHRSFFSSFILFATITGAMVRIGLSDAADYAARELSSLHLSGRDFGWFDGDDPPKTILSQIIQSVLDSQKRRDWTEMAILGDALGNSGFSRRPLTMESVDNAKDTFLLNRNNSIFMVSQLSPENSHFSPVVHVQKELRGKVSVSLVGKELEKCRTLQAKKHWLSLVSILVPPDSMRMSQGYDANGKYAMFLLFIKNKSLLKSKLTCSPFTLICETKINNKDAKSYPRLGLPERHKCETEDDLQPALPRTHNAGGDSTPSRR